MQPFLCAAVIATCLDFAVCITREHDSMEQRRTTTFHFETKSETRRNGINDNDKHS
jgi:hypothetical protein